MATFLSNFAQQHFDESPRKSLLAGLASRIDERNLIPVLGSGCRPLQHLAWQRMAGWEETEVDTLVERAIQAKRAELPTVLKAVSHESLPLSLTSLDRIAELMISPRAEVRLMAARAVALKHPLAAIPMLRRGDDTMDHAVLRTLCLADDPTILIPLMAAFGFPDQSPPPTIGFVVTPEWLGDNYAREPQVVQWLIRHCGYCEEGLCDAEVSRETLNLLSSGFSFVTLRMTSEPRMTKIAHRWQRRIRAFVWRLLPGELDLQRDDVKPLDVTDPLDTDLFLAAVRDSDRMLFLEQRARPPFGREQMKREPSPICFHSSARYVRRLFLSEPLALADQWNIPAALRGDFVIEQARVLLEPNEDARIAADRALRGRWLARTSDSTGTQSTISTGPRSLVIGDFHPPAPDDRLSPGANSSISLAAACGLDRDDIANWLADAESRWSERLVPIGIEVQIPRIDPDRFAAWKEALPFLGVPSLKRPEFGGMLEAAFRPARSFHAMVLAPLLLCRLGVIAEPQDMALHLSLQGDLGDGVKSLAFPHLFIHPSHRLRNRPDWSMARVMSKGFVHVHDDAERLEHESARAAENPLRRTELRLFRLFAESQTVEQPPAHSIELVRGFISDVASVQILGSASISECSQCRALFADYASDIERTVRDLPQEFGSLLASNYFESTGDPRDKALLSLLPIFRCWSSVRQAVRERDLSEMLDLQFRTLRNRHVQQLLQHWTDEHRLSANEVRFIDDEIQLEFPVGVV